MAKNKKGMVFGVFDGLHEGHRYFLHSASEHCEDLTVVIAGDEATRALKGHVPKYSLEERRHALLALNPLWRIIEGDTVQGEWSALKKYQPDIVFLGHDQTALAKELEHRGVAIKFLAAHRPEHFKSSILHETNKTDIE